MAADVIRLAVVLVLATSTGAGGVCPKDILRVTWPGLVSQLHYIEKDGSYSNTTCAKFTHGECPYVATMPKFPCLARCVADERDCRLENDLALGVDKKSNDPHLCRHCPINGCKLCNYETKRATCSECFPSFVGLGGPEGEWSSCELWLQSHIVNFFWIAKYVFMILVVCIIYLFARSIKESIYSNKVSAQLSGTASTPLLEAASAQNEEALHGAQSVEGRNQAAILYGLRMSMNASIQADARRRILGKKHEGTCSYYCRAAWAMLGGGELEGLGVGMQLFFRTQIFLICVSFIVFLFATVAEAYCDGSLAKWMRGTPLEVTRTRDVDIDDIALQHVFLNQCIDNGVLISESDLVQLLGPQKRYATVMRYGLFGLSVVLMLVSFLFHLTQHRFTLDYDRNHITAEDYAIKVSGLPAYITSELRLKVLLEKDLQTKIHSVSICYNLKAARLQDKISETIDNLVESDDIDNGWLPKAVCCNCDALKVRQARDKEELIELLQSKKLQSSGEAFVVFNKQATKLRVLSQRVGISSKFIEKSWEVMKHSEQGGVIHVAVNCDEDEEDISVAKLKPTITTEVGIKFMEFKEEHLVLTRRTWFWIPLKMAFFIGTYIIAAQMFQHFFITPYQKNYVEMEGSVIVTLTGKLLLMLNVGIQTMVQLTVERAGYTDTAHVDQITFVYNTALLLITNGYALIQECYRNGVDYRLDLPTAATPSERAAFMWRRVQSQHLEFEVAESLSNEMTDQILMLYVVGEIANVLLLPLGFFVLLRLAFSSQSYGPEDSYAMWVVTRIRSMLQFLAVGSSDGQVSARQAENAQVLCPLLLWMEYTYIVLFPAMALSIFYISNGIRKVSGWLLVFSVLFYLWQRHIMMWLYGKASFDSPDTYKNFMRLWGLVVSILPPAVVWWSWRLGDIDNFSICIVMCILTYLVSCLFFQLAISVIDQWTESSIGYVKNDFSRFPGNKDPGYDYVVEESGRSYVNTNPVYVLKSRYCPDLIGHEVHGGDVKAWSSIDQKQGFLEPGKEFRHKVNVLTDPGT